MEDELVQKKVFVADDPIWIDLVWVDTVVVVGLTCFILCLMGLSKVRLLQQKFLLSRARLMSPTTCSSR